MAAHELTAAGEPDPVRAATAGDQEAFAQVFRRYGAIVRGVCRGMLRDAEDVEEAVQETFVKAYAALGSRRPGPFDSWLRAIARNVCIDEIRRRGRRPVQVGLTREADAVQRCRAAEIALEEALSYDPRLDRSLARIPAHHRAALELRFLHDLSHREMATVLGTSPFAAKALVHRARERLRREWDAAGEGRALPASA